MSNFINNKKQAGFTLIETFVAIVVLFIAVLGPLNLLSKYISENRFAANQITSFYLAQENTELMYAANEMGALSSLSDCIDSWCVFALNTILNDESAQQVFSVEFDPNSSQVPNQISRIYRDPNIFSYGIQDVNYNEPTVFYRINKVDVVDAEDDNNYGFVIRTIAGWDDGGVFRKTELSSFVTSLIIENIE